MRDCLHEVSFPQSGITVDEEWVIDLAGSLGNGVSGSSGELVGLTNDKMIESVPITKLR